MLFQQLGIKWWIFTSTAPGRAFFDAALRQGVKVVTRMYGSSEVGVFGVACPDSLRDYHITNGNVHVEVVNPEGKSVRTGGRGRVVVTRYGGMTHDGSVTVNEGTQLIRLAVGDMASLVTQPCSCGSTMPRLRDIRPELGQARNYQVSFHEPVPTQVAAAPSPVQSGTTQRFRVPA